DLSGRRCMGPAGYPARAGSCPPAPGPAHTIDRMSRDLRRPLREAWVIEAVRTPVGRYGGALAAVRPDDLAAAVIRAVVDRSGIDTALIEDVILGCANQAGEDNRDVARMALLLAGLPVEVGGLTVNRLCGSGLQAVNSAAHAIAIDGGRFDDQIVPITIPTKKGDPVVVVRDEHPRADTSAEALARLRPAFREGGSVTAGNSSGINDGASAVLLVEAEQARALGLKPMTRIVSTAVAGVDPAIMGYGPVPATRKALERAGISVDDLDLVELNEAFASQALVCIDELGLDPAKVNVNGGAIALGHPLGMSGARLITMLNHELRRTGGRWGLATMCIGVGQGIATVIERIDE